MKMEAKTEDCQDEISEKQAMDSEERGDSDAEDLVQYSPNKSSLSCKRGPHDIIEGSPLPSSRCKHEEIGSFHAQVSSPPDSSNELSDYLAESRESPRANNSKVIKTPAPSNYFLCEMDPKIEVKEEPVWLEGTATSSLGHVRLHTAERPYKCNECGMSFSTSSSLTCHMRAHTLERPYKCSECGTSFNRSGHLTDHMRRHTGEQRYKCKECGKSFTTSSNLNQHMSVHTGERPYTCAIYSMMFKQVGHLSKHMRSHTGE